MQLTAVTQAGGSQFEVIFFTKINMHLSHRYNSSSSFIQGYCHESRQRRQVSRRNYVRKKIIIITLIIKI